MKMPDEYQVKDDTNGVKIHTTSSEEKCFPVLLNGKYACGTTDLISTGVAKSLHRLLLISSLLKNQRKKSRNTFLVVTGFSGASFKEGNAMFSKHCLTPCPLQSNQSCFFFFIP